SEAFGRPVKVMQARGSYRSGKMAFLGLGNGTRVGASRGRHRHAHGTRATPIQDGDLRGLSGLKGLKLLGITKCRECVHHVVVKFMPANSPTSSLAAETSLSSTSCRPAAGPETTP